MELGPLHTMQPDNLALGFTPKPIVNCGGQIWQRLYESPFRDAGFISATRVLAYYSNDPNRSSFGGILSVPFAQFAGPCFLIRIDIYFSALRSGNWSVFSTPEIEHHPVLAECGAE